MTNFRERIGPYQVLSEAGRGGMATVYRARDTRDGRQVALKVMAPEAGDDARFARRLANEGERARDLAHPNIVRVFDVGQSGQYRYIAQEYVDGGTLGQRLAAGPLPMEPGEALAILAQVAEGLEYAHSRGYLHCDIKAGNVLLSADGRALISDFDIARRIDGGDGPGEIGVGTLEYVSPEVACGEPNIDRRSDIYSLGVLAYYMLVGQLPFEAETDDELLRKVVEEFPPPPESRNPQISIGIAYALSRALAKDPNARYGSATEFVEALQAGVTRGSHEPAFEASRTARMEKGRRRSAGARRGVSASLMAALAGFLALAALSLASLASVGSAPDLGDIRRLFGRAEPTAVMQATRTPWPTYTGTPRGRARPALATTPTAGPAATAQPAPTVRAMAGDAVVVTVFPLLSAPAAMEDFATSAGGWSESQDATARWWLEDGAFRLALHPANTRAAAWRGISVGDFTAAVDARSLLAYRDVHFGMIFGARDTSNYYQLDFLPGAGCELARWTNGQSTVLLPRTVAPQQMLTDSVRLSVTAEGASLKIGVDSQTIATLNDPSRSRGDLALYGASGSQAEAGFAFDNFEFRPGTDETTPVPLVAYHDPDGRFSLSVPEDWAPKTDAGSTTFQSADGWARVYVLLGAGGMPAAESPEAAARQYVAVAATSFQDIQTEPGAQTTVGGLDAYDQRARARVADVDVVIHMLAFGHGQTGVVFSVAEARREPVLRPLLDYILQSIRIHVAAATATPTTTLTVTTPAEATTEATVDQPTGTPTPGSTGTPAAAAAPAAGRIAYSAWNASSGHYDVYVYRLSDGSQSLYVGNARQPDFNKKGELVANGDGGGMENIVRVDANGGNKHAVSAHPEDAHPSWSASGISIVFDSTLAGQGQHNLYLQEDAGYAHEVPPIKASMNQLYGRYPVYLANWRIAFNGCNYWASGSTCGIYTTDTRWDPAKVTDNPGDIPTGQRGSEILFMSPREGNNWDVYAVSNNGGSPRRLTDNPGRDGLGAASPDGNHVAFVTDRDGRWSLYIMDADGSNQRKLADTGGYGSGEWDWTQERLSWGP